MQRTARLVSSLKRFLHYRHFFWISGAACASVAKWSDKFLFIERIGIRKFLGVIINEKKILDDHLTFVHSDQYSEPETFIVATLQSVIVLTKGKNTVLFIILIPYLSKTVKVFN